MLIKASIAQYRPQNTLRIPFYTGRSKAFLQLRPIHPYSRRHRDEKPILLIVTGMSEKDMTKRQLIDEIRTINLSANPAFLAGFEDTELSAYLHNLNDTKQSKSPPAKLISRIPRAQSNGETDRDSHTQNDVTTSGTYISDNVLQPDTIIAPSVY